MATGRTPIFFLFTKVFILLFFGFFATKNTFAVGTCDCSVNQSRSWFLLINKCDPVSEYPSGCDGSAVGNPYAKCECKKKEDSRLPVNECTCNGSGVITASSCQGSTPRENCITQAQPTYCYCSAETSNRTDTYIPPRPGTPEAIELEIKANSNQNFWCGGSGGEKKEITTAIGCIPITVNGLVQKLLPNIFGIAGGIAFFMMVYGFIMVSTSSGDEKKAQEAQKIITSAITGLLVAIFALFLYKLIAVDILHIPGIN